MKYYILYLLINKDKDAKKAPFRNFFKDKRFKTVSIRFFSFKDVQDFIKDLVETQVNFLPDDYFKNKSEKADKLIHLNDFLQKALEQHTSDLPEFENIGNEILFFDRHLLYFLF